MNPRLLKKAEMVALGTARSDPITVDGEFPPCFDSMRKYSDWKKSIVDSPVLKRDDFRKEPNYCRDCTEWYRDKMKSEDRCLFPETRFKRHGTGDDLEVVGYTPRSLK